MDIIGPKGTFELEVGQKKALFTLLSETICKANKEYSVTIPWYIMTSVENNEKTVQFFEHHNYFGMGRQNIKFFIQNEFPMIDTKGNVLVGEDGLVKKAADRTWWNI